VEFAAGVRAHSLALISDAGHNLTDALALLLAWFGVYLQSKPADESRTYGYHRGGVLAAFANALTLVGLSGWIGYESVVRLRDPRPVSEGIMMAVAFAGLVLNGGIAWALHRASKEDLNIRSAFVHMIGDALGSLGIVIGAAVIRLTGWLWVDPALSLVIAALIVWTAWDVMREALNILLEGLPRGITLPDVTDALCACEGVLNVHDLHIWSLGSATHALSCHVVIDDVPPSASDAILQRLNAVLARRYRIYHTTVQFEHVGCSISAYGCAIPVPHSHHHGEHGC
jgi:cobalt-zinc-cadmium efflux system protein